MKKNFSKQKHFFTLYYHTIEDYFIFIFSLFFSFLPFLLDATLLSISLMKRDMPKTLLSSKVLTIM